MRTGILDHRSGHRGGLSRRTAAEGQRAKGQPAPLGARRDRGTGFEPFVFAAVAGLGIWALLLSPWLI